MMSLELFSDIILPVALRPWGRLSLWQKWVPGVFPGGKGGRCVRLTTLPPSCAVAMISGNFNFLEPSGPLQASNGTALPLPILKDGVSNCAHMASKVWVVVNNELKMCDRKWLTSNKMQYHAIVWRYREKQQTNSAKIVGDPVRFELGFFQIRVRSVTPWFKFLGTCLVEWLGCDSLNFTNVSASTNTVGTDVLT